MKCPECETENTGDPTHCRLCKTRLKDGTASSAADGCEVAGCGERWRMPVAGKRLCFRHYEDFMRAHTELLPATCRAVMDDMIRARAMRT